MPLPDEPWERGKCGYKLIQYMAAGRPIVASPVGVNTQIVTTDVGFLAASPAEWVKHIDRLAADPDLRQTMGMAARRRVEQHYSLQVMAPRICALLSATANQQ
jgi:glycosyltransferase involved in cell wall biosynthesis